MVLDSSVVLHLLFEEPRWQDTVAFLLRQERLRLSVASLITVQAVMAGRFRAGPEQAIALLDELLTELGVERMALDLRQAELARWAYLRFGKGQRHAARLNYGDVMAYALAKSLDEPLAFVGDDFQHTDIAVVRLPPEVVSE